MFFLVLEAHPSHGEHGDAFLLIPRDRRRSEALARNFPGTDQIYSRTGSEADLPRGMELLK